MEFIGRLYVIFLRSILVKQRLVEQMSAASAVAGILVPVFMRAAAAGVLPVPSGIFLLQT